MYVGGAFKAFSLIKCFRHLGMKVVIVGSQTGTKEEYEELAVISDPGTIIVDDTNPSELSALYEGKGCGYPGGRHQGKTHRLQTGASDSATTTMRESCPWKGFTGMYYFAREVHATVMSPVWRFTPRRSGRSASGKELNYAAA